MKPEEVVPQIKDVLLMPGWNDVIKPGLGRLRDLAILELINPNPKKPVSDDFSRGQINVLNWMLNWDQRAERLAAELIGQQDNPEPEGVGTVLGPDGAPTAPPQQ